MAESKIHNGSPGSGGKYNLLDFTERLPMMVPSMWCSGFVYGTLPAPRQQQLQAENAMK